MKTQGSLGAKEHNYNTVVMYVVIERAQSFVIAQSGCPMLTMTLMNLSVRMFIRVGEESHGKLLGRVAPLQS